MDVKFIDLNAAYQEQKQDIDAAIQYTIANSDYILGEGCSVFENEFAAYCGVKYGVGVHSGLSALELSLRVLDIGKGDEVITVANSFVATALAISAVGARIVLVDCGEDFLIDVSKIEEAITPKTKAIIPVHLFGKCCSMYDITHLSIAVIEDASQAHGATYRNQKVGTFGDIACFSLYPAKNLGAFSDAGIILTDNEGYYNAFKKLRNYGSGQKYYHDEVGTNSRLSTLNARVLSVKLRKLDDWNRHRNWVAKQYFERLNGVGDIQLPIESPHSYHAWHQYVIQTQRRDKLQEHLKENGVPTLIHYPIPIHKQKCYEELNHLSFPITERLAKTILSLPIHPYLTLDEIEYITSTIKSFYE